MTDVAYEPHADGTGRDAGAPAWSGSGAASDPAAPARAGADIPSLRDRLVDLSELVRARPTDRPDVFWLDVPDGVQQGRGAWGGVASGAMTSAATQVTTRPGQVVRTMSAQLIAPLLTGRATVRTEILREGSATTTVAARVESRDGAVLAHGVVVLGSARTGEAMPDGPDWSTVEVPAELAVGPEDIPVLPARPPAPDFLRQIELRPTAGLPFSGDGGNEARGWLRPVAPVSRVDAALVVALADTWWVAVMARLDRPRPVGTVGFACEVAGDPAAVRVDARGRLEPLFHRGRLIAAREGFTVETRELWTASGQLLTWNTQTVAVIK
jgi:hypothetical protein